MATASVNTETVFETQTVVVPVGEKKTVTLILTEDEAFVVATLAGSTSGPAKSEFRQATTAVWDALTEALGDSRGGYTCLTYSAGWQRAHDQLKVAPQVKDV